MTPKVIRNESTQRVAEVLREIQQSEGRADNPRPLLPFVRMVKALPAGALDVEIEAVMEKAIAAARIKELESTPGLVRLAIRMACALVLAIEKCPNCSGSMQDHDGEQHINAVCPDCRPYVEALQAMTPLQDILREKTAEHKS